MYNTCMSRSMLLKMYCVAALILFVGVTGNVHVDQHHDHYSFHNANSNHPPVTDCLGKTCDAFKPTCAITIQTGESHCEFDDHCNIHNQLLCQDAVIMGLAYDQCCCKDNACVEHYKLIMGTPTTTPPVKIEVNPTPAVHSVGTTSDICRDNTGGVFDCAYYDKTFGVCSHVTGIGGNIALNNCRETCNNCGASVHVATTPGQATVVPHNVVCVDHDVNKNCFRLKDAICSAATLSIREYAIANCAKTCNLCTEYFGALTSLNG